MQETDGYVNMMPPEVAEELEAVRKAVDGLRAGAAAYKKPEPLDASHLAVIPLAAAHDTAMKELEPLGFRSVGDTGEPRKDGSTAVSRWFCHEDGTISGWLAYAKTRTGSHLVMFFMSEAPGPTYCTTLRGGSGLSLARPPHLTRAVHDAADDLASVVRDHRERLAELASGAPTKVTTLQQAIDVNERAQQARMAWRASVDEAELLRADLRAVLEHSQSRMSATDFSLVYGEAAKWLGLEVADAAPPFQATSDTPLADFLAARPDAPAAQTGDPGEESPWLFHCEFPLRGRRLQLLDVYGAGNDDGVVLDATPGIYAVEARVMTYGRDLRISRVRVYPNGGGARVITGPKAGEVGVDLAAVALCDVDRLASWAQGNEDAWQDWGDALWYNRPAQVGLYPCEPADTVVVFVDSGFGDGTYPVYHVLEDGRPVGLEAVFLPPGAPYH